jgi:nucleoside-diphosphate-sugar epimerase
MNNAVIAGATGLIGSELQQLVEKRNNFDALFALGRSAPETTPKTRFIKADFNNLEQLKLPAPAAVAFCCLGTTMKSAGSKEAFHKVDYEFVLNYAQWCYAQQVKHFVLVSAQGAAEDSFFYYNKVKGKLENAVEHIHFNSLSILQPNLLIGKRDENRPGEAIAQSIYHLLPGPLKSLYPAIKATTVAEAMYKLAIGKASEGIKRYGPSEIEALAE